MEEGRDCPHGRKYNFGGAEGEVPTPGLARAETGKLRPIGAGRGLSLYRQTRPLVARIAEGGPGRGGGQVLSNPN